MKKALFTLLGLVSVLFFVGTSAGYTTLTLTTPNQSPLLLSGSGYDFVFDGVDTSKSIESAVLDVFLYDDNDRTLEIAYLIIDGMFAEFNPVGGSVNNPECWSYDVLNYLSDGAVGFDVGSVSGDFVFSKAELNVTTHAPIPSAVWLLGFGLIGIVGVRRRFMSN